MLPCGRASCPVVTFMAQEWNIRPRGHHCQDCEKPFAENELCHSALQSATRPDGASVLERMDRCRNCWERTVEPSIISVWQSPYHAPEPAPPDPAARQTVEALLRRLLESDDAAAQQPVLYVLALMLERKKLLIERDIRRQDDGTLLRVYEHRRTGEVLLIGDPGLQMNQLAPVQEQVAELLSRPTEPEPAETALGRRPQSPASPER